MRQQVFMHDTLAYLVNKETFGRPLDYDTRLRPKADVHGSHLELPGGAMDWVLSGGCEMVRKLRISRWTSCQLKEQDGVQNRHNLLKLIFDSTTIQGG